ncbi:Signal-induced proliferation-associated 1-like protein 1 [Allomyces javanicus]|nr:Signal-induced proliferation-associated 1-like protein 1 [Allomyces javanicus]
MDPDPPLRPGARGEQVTGMPHLDGATTSPPGASSASASASPPTRRAAGPSDRSHALVTVVEPPPDAPSTGAHLIGPPAADTEDPILRRISRASATSVPASSGHHACVVCGQGVYTFEACSFDGMLYHRKCFKCVECKKPLSLMQAVSFNGDIYCPKHNPSVPTAGAPTKRSFLSRTLRRPMSILTNSGTFMDKVKNLDGTEPILAEEGGSKASSPMATSPISTSGSSSLTRVVSMRNRGHSAPANSSSSSLRPLRLTAAALGSVESEALPEQEAGEARVQPLLSPKTQESGAETGSDTNADPPSAKSWGKSSTADSRTAEPPVDEPREWISDEDVSLDAIVDAYTSSPTVRSRLGTGSGTSTAPGTTTANSRSYDFASTDAFDLLLHSSASAGSHASSSRSQRAGVPASASAPISRLDVVSKSCDALAASSNSGGSSTSPGAPLTHAKLHASEPLMHLTPPSPTQAFGMGTLGRGTIGRDTLRARGTTESQDVPAYPSSSVVPAYPSSSVVPPLVAERDGYTIEALPSVHHVSPFPPSPIAPVMEVPEPAPACVTIARGRGAAMMLARTSAPSSPVTAPLDPAESGGSPVSMTASLKSGTVFRPRGANPWLVDSTKYDTFVPLAYADYRVPGASELTVLEHVDVASMYYRSHFASLAHNNYVAMIDGDAAVAAAGTDDAVLTGPLVFSIRRDEHQGIYRMIVRTVDRDFRIEVPMAETKSRVRRRKELIKYVYPRFPMNKLIKVRSPRVVQDLVKLDELQLCFHVKVGVVYMRHGQTTEEQVFGNETHSPAFESFLWVLGRRVALAGFEGFDGGLDTKHNHQGTHSFYARARAFKIMAHVSTLLPYSDRDVQQIARKSLIGNDIVCIVFNDRTANQGEDTAPAFDPRMIRSQYLTVYIIVEPCILAGVAGYRVAVTSQADVPAFGPPLPPDAFFADTVQLQHFLWAKVINAECAAIKAAKFQKLHARTRRMLLDDVTQFYIKTQGEGKPAHSSANADADAAAAAAGTGAGGSGDDHDLLAPGTKPAKARSDFDLFKRSARRKSGPVVMPTATSLAADEHLGPTPPASTSSSSSQQPTQPPALSPVQRMFDFTSRRGTDKPAAAAEQAADPPAEQPTVGSPPRTHKSRTGGFLAAMGMKRKGNLGTATSMTMLATAAGASADDEDVPLP